jgi:cation diffusion facilitator family transporter
MSASPSQTPATTAASAQDESLASVLVALAANTAVAVAKGTAAALTGSPALLAETLHTVADAGNEVFLYVAIRRSRRPADPSHPFGYGPERYFWALLAAIGIFVIGGAVSIWNGVNALLHPPELEAFWVGVVVLVVALALDGISRVVAVRQLRVQAARREVSLRELLRESPDPTVVTVYFEDTVDVLGALLALVALVLHRVPNRPSPMRSPRSSSAVCSVTWRRGSPGATANCSPTSRCPSATCSACATGSRATRRSTPW